MTLIVESENDTQDTVKRIMDMMNEAKWIPDPTYSQSPPIYICSHCKREAFEDYIEGQQMFRYCPYCGCYMVNYEDFDHSDD